MKRLDRAQQQFVLHWGEMGSRWGVSRSVAQVHALLYISAEALPADRIASELSMARSNVSTSLRELEGWGIVRQVHVLGDRRTYFQAVPDVWETLTVVLEERKRRELDPTIAVLKRSLSGAEGETKKRLEEMLSLFETLAGLFAVFKAMAPEDMRRLAQTS
jgi:DNA-binding transcriptional regulator GbsR (MarR family)